MCFLLNERTRELCGEGYRWEDLARTKTLDARWHAFNDGVSRGIGEFDPAIHYYRPIPQSYLDGVTNNSGAALTNEVKTSFAKPWILIVLSIKYQEVFLSKEEHLLFCTNLQQHVQSSIPEKSSFPVLCKINSFSNKTMKKLWLIGLLICSPFTMNAQSGTTSGLDKSHFSKYWKVESESPDYKVSFSGDTCEILSPKGLTLWRKEKIVGQRNH